MGIAGTEIQNRNCPNVQPSIVVPSSDHSSNVTNFLNNINEIVNYSESQTGENKVTVNNEDSFNSHSRETFQNQKEEVSSECKKATLSGSVRPRDNQHPKDRRDGSPDSLPQRNEPKIQEYLNPQRYWEKDMSVPPPSNFNHNNNNNYNNDRNQVGNYNVVSQQPHFPHHQRNQNRNNGNDYNSKPKHISENTRHFTTVGPNGSTLQVTTSSTRHDGEEVYNRSEQNIRLKKMEQLKSNGNVGKLQGSQRPNSLKVFITRVNPETTSDQMELFLLENFPSLDRVVIRKQPMHHSRNYQSFVIILVSKKVLDICEFENYDWPDDIKCFPGINNYERNV